MYYRCRLHYYQWTNPIPCGQLDQMEMEREIDCDSDRPVRIVTIFVILLPFFLSLLSLISEQLESLLLLNNIVTVLQCFILSVLFSIITFSNSSLVWSLSLALVARPVLWYEQYCSYPSFLTELVEMTVERERGSFHFQTGLIYRENHVWIQFQRSQLSSRFFLLWSACFVDCWCPSRAAVCWRMCLTHIARRGRVLPGHKIAGATEQSLHSSLDRIDEGTRLR